MHVILGVGILRGGHSRFGGAARSRAGWSVVVEGGWATEVVMWPTAAVWELGAGCDVWEVGIGCRVGCGTPTIGFATVRGGGLFRAGVRVIGGGIRAWWAWRCLGGVWAESLRVWCVSSLSGCVLGLYCFESLGDL